MEAAAIIITIMVVFLSGISLSLCDELKDIIIYLMQIKETLYDIRESLRGKD